MTANLKMAGLDPDGIVRLASQGDLTVEQLRDSVNRNPIAELLGDSWAGHRILLDLSNSNYIDSSAVGWLISSHKDLNAKGGRLVVHSVRPQVQQVFDLLRVSKLIPLASDEAQARAMVKENNGSP